MEADMEFLLNVEKSRINLKMAVWIREAREFLKTKLS